MRILIIALCVLGLGGCGCSVPPAEPAPEPKTEREAAVKALEAHETLFGQEGAGGSQALEQMLEQRDALEAQQREAMRAASGDEAMPEE